MRLAIMIPVFLAYMSVISRFFFTAKERGRLAVSFILLGLVGVLSFIIWSAYHSVDQGGFIQVNRDRSALREIVGRFESLPKAAAQLMHDGLGPRGMVLGIAFACLLLVMGAVLYLLHKNAADPD